MIVDFHMHTLYSDGGLSVDDIITEANKNEVSFISITDHNTYLTYRRRNIKNIKYITGMEVDVDYKNITLHMLLYNFNLKSKLLNRYYKNNRRYEIRCFRKMIRELLDKYDINLDTNRVNRFIKNNNYFDRVRLNNLLVECGICDNARNAYYSYTKKIKSHKRKSISIKELFRLEKDSKGIVSLAHPLRYGVDLKSIETIIIELKEKYNLRVVEAINNRQNLEEEKQLLEFCKNNALFISAGSDTHYKIGSNDTKEVGIINNRKVEDSEITFLNLI